MILVTGANAGIGKATALALAARGGTVLLGCRSASKTAPVVDEIASATGNAAVEHLPLDLADLDSVRAAAAQVVARGEPLQTVVNNAGVAGQRGTTAQGFELAFGINHLGHFLLTTLLLDLLRESRPARVVNVSSDSHYRAKGVDFRVLRRPTTSFTGMPEYGVYKLCNVLFTQELSRRVPADEIAAHSLHPGVIASEIWRRVPWPVRPVMKRFMKSPEEGAETTVWCATSPNLDGVSGRFYVDCREKDPNPAATPELAAELWARSEAWAAATNE